MNKTPPPGDRIAKVIARAGRASRREAERLIAEGRVAVNGEVIDRAALNVTESDKITVDDIPLDAPEPPRLWLYHKPTGLVTTTRDEQGRSTIYDELPEDLPRVMSVGRLDLNSEGLLLLTNDGGVKRRLELPSTGWLRRYRVRIKGRPQDADFNTLREGITIEGERFQPMIVSLDRQQGANAWVTVALREGKNREVRRAMEALNFSVNRLIRISYGPFQLGNLKPGEVQEVRGRVLRDQLGLEGGEPPEGTAKPKKPGGVKRRRPGGSDDPKNAPSGATPKHGRSTGLTGASRGPSGGKPAKSGPRSTSAGAPDAKPDTKTGAKFGARFSAKPGAKPASDNRPQGRPAKPGAPRDRRK